MVKENAAALGEALVQSEQYKEYVLAKAAVDTDIQASNLLGAYAEIEREISDAMVEGVDTTKDINALSAQLQSMRKRITDNENIGRLAAAQVEFNSLMEGVNQIIAHYIAPESSCSSDSCSGGCSGCSSCQ